MEAYSYTLPAERIAQRPVHPYDAARLLLIDREDKSLEESTFSSLDTLLGTKDLLLINNTKVIPARLFGSLASSSAKIELLLVKEREKGIWECLGRPLKKLKEGSEIVFSDTLSAFVQKRLPENRILVSFKVKDSELLLESAFAQVAVMPIPPYIRKGHADLEDEKDYQTLFAELDGSVAAPTASLHFTPQLLERVQNKCQMEFVTLHVGTASFLPLWKNGEEEMATAPGTESFCYSENVVQKIQDTKSNGGRVIAVGTTVVRAVESMLRVESAEDGDFLETSLFIQPSFEFKAIDALITNFHQPRTTHLLLVEALLGRELLESAYTTALEKDYRFLSYGDAMFIK